MRAQVCGAELLKWTSLLRPTSNRSIRHKELFHTKSLDAGAAEAKSRWARLDVDDDTTSQDAVRHL